MPPPRYVELIRVSSAGQADKETPQDQRNALERLAANRPGTLVERIDHGARGLSGAADLAQRPDLQRLAELSRARAYDELRLRHVDRLTRHDDPRERFAIYGMVADAGAVIIDAGGHVIDPRSEMGEVDYWLQTWASSRERKKIVERTVAARKRLSAQGRPMTTIPYARTYDFATGTWGIDEARVSTYRRIFREVIAGTSLHRLATKLNREGISAPRGGAWEASSLRRMIRNGSAVGRMTSYGHPVSCPPVVDEVTQRRAIAAMKAGRSHSGPPPKREALLRKLLTCGVCGRTMQTYSSGEGAILYYRCAGMKPKLCSHRTGHPVAEVDAAVVDALERAARHPRRLARAAATTPETGTAEEDAKGIRRELDKLDRREEGLIRMRSQGEVRDEMFRRQSAEIANQRADAEARLAAAESVLDAAQSAQERAREAISAVEALRSRARRATRHDWRRLLETLYPRQPGTWIRIHPDGRVETNPSLGEP